MVMDEWVQWLRDFRTEATAFVQDLVATPADTDDAELQSIRFAVYARLLTLLDTAINHAGADKQLDLRITAREIIECAIHLEAAARIPEYVQKIKDDDRASRRSLVKAASDDQPPSDPATRRLVQEFMNNKTGKRVQPTDLGKGSDFKRLILIYREISSDSAHVTLTALGRHVRADDDGVNRMITDPPLDEGELFQSLSGIALSALLCTWLLVKAVPSSGGSAELTRLGQSYQSIYRRDRHLEHRHG